MKKEGKPKLTSQERIAKYLAAVPPAISGAGGHNQTFSVACSLYRGWNLSEENTLAWLKVYNERCEPKWTEKELAHKAASATRSAHNKPRGHLIGERGKEQTEQSDKPLAKPIASGKISATLATLKAGLPSSYREVYTHGPLFTSSRKESGINVANVAEQKRCALVTRYHTADTGQPAVANVAGKTSSLLLDFDHGRPSIPITKTKAQTASSPCPQHKTASPDIAPQDGSSSPYQGRDLVTLGSQSPRPTQKTIEVSLDSETRLFETEIRRIVSELERLHQDFAIREKSVKDPDASFYANLLHVFGATYTGLSRTPVGPVIVNQCGLLARTTTSDAAP